jgi:hypothetical protein
MNTSAKYALKAGDKDCDGNTVRTVYARDETYIVYDTADRQLIFTGENEELIGQDSNVNRMLIQIGDFITHTPTLKRHYTSPMAFAMKIFFDGNPKGSYSSLRSIYRDIRRHLTRRAKLSYQVGALILMVIALIVFLLVHWSLTLSELGTNLFTAIVFASMGGFLSVVIGSRNLRLDLQNNVLVNMGYGGIRIVIAIISGVVIYFLVETKVVFGFLKDAPNLYGLIVVAFVTGFSESLIPNLVKKIEDQVERQEQKEKGSSEGDQPDSLN